MKRKYLSKVQVLQIVLKYSAGVNVLSYFPPLTTICAASGFEVVLAQRP